MSDYLTYARFHTPEDSRMLTELLHKHSIEYQINHEVNHLDKIYIGESLDPLFIVRIQQSDFNRVTQLLALQADSDVLLPNFDHYFKYYERGELEEVLNNPNDWNVYDYRIALALLNTNSTYNELNIVNYSEFYKPETLEFKWILIGYLLCFLTILGVIFGLSITQANKTLQNGSVVKIYDKPTIGHGKNMIVFGTIMTLFIIFSKLRQYTGG